MRALLQRVSRANVRVDDQVTANIGAGLLVFLGVHRDDSERDAEWLAQKVLQLRIFEDDIGRMNRNVKDAGGSILIVSQFTLYGEARKGNRPSFSEAAGAGKAEKLYELFVRYCRDSGLPLQTGKFRAHMQVELLNDGPVTLLCESAPTSKNAFVVKN
jgi:D-tyrosyl-tRNA(Tyr) deacylase